uniref:(northern house mosquito) hypothetical protein n=1 Tax=Culex pipiens TaxID=7175 RepID=A0A8D8ERJ2_CULPI
MLSSHKSSLRKIYTLYLFLNRYCKEFSLFEVDRAAALANCVYLKLLVMIFMSCFVVTVPSRIPDEHVFQVGFIFQQYYWLQCLLLMNLFQVLFFFLLNPDGQFLFPTQSLFRGGPPPRTSQFTGSDLATIPQTQGSTQSHTHTRIYEVASFCAACCFCRSVTIDVDVVVSQSTLSSGKQ